MEPVPPSPPHSRRQVVVGLAGHIDHGKSALVHRLTGAATDRRPEEQQRGMTVDLGFAHFDQGDDRITLIDVPGHDRFVHNMVSGAVGVDLGLLVVAADDSVMPQTREHLEILDLLGVPGGAIAITKADLVDADRLTIVRDDITELVRSTTFARTPIVAVSSVDGRGVDEIRSALVAQTGQVPLRRQTDGPFRMAIDRAFTLPGHGTIVTGTVRRGRLRPGDSALLLFQEQPVKVRQLQRQGQSVEVLTAGDRAAVNLAGVKVSEVGRGDELATGPAWKPTRRLMIRLSVLPRSKWEIGDREEVRLHVGTREVTARVRLPQPAADPGQQSIAILECEKPVVAEYGQPVILRRLSPARTLGGGPVLSTHIAPHERIKRLWPIGELLVADGLEDRLRGYLMLSGPADVGEIDWSLEIGMTSAEVIRVIDRLVCEGAFFRNSRAPRIVMTAEQWEGLIHSVRRHCEQQSRRQYPQRWINSASIVQRFAARYPTVALESALDALIEDRWLTSRDADVALADRIPLSRRDQQLQDSLEEVIAAAGAAPPLRKELADRFEQSEKVLEPLLDRLAGEGRVVRVSEELAVTPEVLERLLSELRERFVTQSTVSVAEIRDRWQVTRKHALPYLQYFDQAGYTVRSGPVRRPGPRMECPSPRDSPS